MGIEAVIPKGTGHKCVFGITRRFPGCASISGIERGGAIAMAVDTVVRTHLDEVRDPPAARVTVYAPDRRSVRIGFSGVGPNLIPGVYVIKAGSIRADGGPKSAPGIILTILSHPAGGGASDAASTVGTVLPPPGTAENIGGFQGSDIGKNYAGGAFILPIR